MTRMLQVVAAWVWRSFAAIGRTVLHPLAIWVSDKDSAFGLELVDFSSGIEWAAKFDSVKQALSLIQRHDPIWIRRLATDVNQIVIAPIAGAGGEYWSHSKSIVLDVSALKSQSTATTAMLIVHEGMHARLRKRGISHDDRERVERICVRAEIAFARRVPGTERLIDGARAKLDLRWWEAPQSTSRILHRIEALPLPTLAKRLLSTAVARGRHD